MKLWTTGLWPVIARCCCAGQASWGTETVTGMAERASASRRHAPIQTIGCAGDHAFEAPGFGLDGLSPGVVVLFTLVVDR